MKGPVVSSEEPEGVLKLIQPLIQSKTWDYCVLWELGEDPSRFIEWSSCSCVGSYGVCENVKMENGESTVSVRCRDTHVHHPLWTTACQTLARFPSSISLYSGTIHGEVAISNQSRWIVIQDDNSNFHPSKESGGTRVVIPVVGGLIELYSRNQIPRDERMIKLIMSQHSIMSNQCPDPFNRLMVVPSPHEETTCLKCEGSSINSSPLSHSDPNSFVSNSSHLSLAIHLGPKKIDLSKPVNELLAEKDVNLKSVQKTQKEYRSKNLVTERNRRTRIKDGLYKLRSAVPNITKMDKASILGDAVKYIEDLKKMAVELQIQLDELDKQDDYCDVIRNMESKDVIRSRGNLQTRKQNPLGGRKAMKPEVELSQISAREFSLKVHSEKRRGGLTRLLEAVCCLGLQVIDANTTSFDGKSLTILTLQVVNKVNNVELKSLRDSLRKMIEC
ncbi:transcription factor ABORTED MICROSPORES-like [Impatiens glandulifera]|uniref:transcription factor ABORTED MICROSPORES-like n=1 Tax=Impatiens glandulifera TaxID=253017 RepID=UPI001FB18CE0|nr:transcription factor ABORTED MICROSPORES-like [Impatiens glandulifera]